MNDPGQVRKIAILRANALGDLIVTLPAIEAVHAAYPQAEIVLLGRPLHKEFLVKGRTAVNRVIVIPVSKGLREEAGREEDAGELSAFFREMKKEAFDIAIHFHGRGIAANPFINKLGARLTAGMTCPGAEPIDRAIDFYYYQNEVMRYLEVVSLVGAMPVCIEPRINLLDGDISEAAAFIEKNTARSFIVMHPCGTDARRSWTSEHFACTADLLTDEGYEVIFTGSAGDRTAVAQIRSMMRHSAIDSCGMLSLGGLAALMKKSSLVIASDTGPLHLARAAGAKTVGIYWGPNLINWGPVTREDHRPVISWELHCPRCGIIPNDPWPFEPHVAGCDHSLSFVKNITPRQVMEQAMLLLKKGRSGSSGIAA